MRKLRLEDWSKISEAETIHWNKMKSHEKKELLKGVRLPSTLARDKWKNLDFRAKEMMGKFISQTTSGEYRLAEEELTPAQKKKKEEIVLSMKKKKKEFQDRYGDEWESVMYATATKMAKESINEARRGGRGVPAPLPKATGFALRMPIKDKKHGIELAKIVGVETDRKGLVQTGRKEGDSYVFYFKNARDRTKFRDKYLRNEEIANTTAGVAGLTPDTVGRPVSRKKKKKKRREIEPMLTTESRKRVEKAIRAMNSSDSKEFKSEIEGMPVFKVSEAEFAKCKGKRAKGERWNKFFEGDSPNYSGIRSYAKKNPNSPLVVQNNVTGEMTIFRRRMNDGRLKHNKKKKMLGGY